VAVLAVAAALLGGCSSMSDDTKEAVQNVLTLEMGAVSDARACRGMGPFRDYAVAPEEMLGLVEGALLTKTPAVFVNQDAREVVAKERCEGLAASDAYGDDWLSAVVVTVHPVAEDPLRSRVEFHAVQKGTFKKGRIDWAREMPVLLDAAAARRTRGLRPIR
jgi:hypothetical protein